ncbi:hypothetical protein HDV06_002147 [Boothiomyces sp. JEL0866]|nr:hypothetical protein HDV06_002147 [Boothiomyces sp. JEL0866]
MTEKPSDNIMMFAVHSNKRAYENDLVNYYDCDIRSYNPAKRFRPSPTLKRQRDDDAMDIEPKRTCIYQPLYQPPSQIIPYTPNNFTHTHEEFTLKSNIAVNNDVYFPLLKPVQERIDPEHGQLVLWRPQ